MMAPAQRYLLNALTLALCIWAGGAGAQTIVTAEQALRMARGGEITIIDIRRPDEWRETGIPAGAELATVRTIRGPAEFLRRIAKLTKGDKSTPIALICAAGVRSKHASRLLQSRGYTQVLDISEGMLGSRAGTGWLARKLPVKACDGC
jgi:rhodanese-related sulfurtransferase